MVDKKEILWLLNQHFETTGEVTISDKGLVSCTGDVELKNMQNFQRFPVSFEKVDGSFLCVGGRLTSLEGAPQRVGGDFDCTLNNLTLSLDGLSSHIEGVVSLNYYPRLPLLRTLAAKKGVKFVSSSHLIPTPLSEDAQHVQKILNRYAGQGEAGAFLCGAELANEGFKENARW